MNMKIKQNITTALARLSLGFGIMVLPFQGLASDDPDPADQEMLVVGETEMLFVTEAGCEYNSRIDTGAKTCSIYAEAIEEFERDGVRWVSFKLVNPANKKAVELESRVERVVKIKLREGQDALSRYVVKLEVTIGERTIRVEFNLADRSDYEYPLLVGRNLLRGVALVDVSKTYMLGKKARQPNKVKP
jgi:hypothetical protein